MHKSIFKEIVFVPYVPFCGLFNWSENGRRVVRNSDRKAGVRTEVGETFDACEIETQTRCSDLHAESHFCLRLCSKWTITRSRVRASVNFARNAELFVDAEDAGEPVSQHVVLCEELGRRSENRDTEIAERIQASITTKLLAHQDLPERVCLIETDAARFVRVWKFHAKTKSE